MLEIIAGVLAGYFLMPKVVVWATKWLNNHGVK